MQRVTISMSDDFAGEVEEFMARHGYENRSEALRDLARSGLEQAHLKEPDGGECFAVVAYVYDHHTRDIPRRLTEAYHGRHDLTVATLHVHLDHDSCLEVAVMRGDTSEVRAFSTSVIAERGVSHGHVTIIPVEIEVGGHSHGGPAQDENPGAVHLHARPRG